MSNVLGHIITEEEIKQLISEAIMAMIDNIVEGARVSSLPLLTNIFQSNLNFSLFRPGM